MQQILRVEKLTESGPKVSSEANLSIGSCWFDPLVTVLDFDANTEVHADIHTFASTQFLQTLRI